LWDARTGKLVGPPAPLHYGGSSVRFSPDGKLIATTSGGHGAIWQAHPFKFLADFKTGSILTFTADGKGLFSQSLGKDVEQWDITPGRKPALVRQWADAEQVSLSPDGLIALSAIRWYGVWAADGKLLWRRNRAAAVESVMKFSADGRTLLVGGTYYRGELALHNARTGEVLDTFALDKDLCDFVLHKDDRVVVLTKAEDRRAALIRLTMRAEFQSTAQGTGRAVFSSDGSKIITAHLVWDLTKGISKPHGAFGQNFNVWHGPGTTAVMNFSGKTSIVDYARGGKPIDLKPGYPAMAGKWLLQTTDEGTVRIHDATNGKVVGGLPTEGTYFTKLVASAGGRWAAGLDPDKEAALWDVPARKAIKRWTRTAGIERILLPPDEKTLLVLGQNRKLTARELPSLKARWQIRVPSDGSRFAFSPDGRALALIDDKSGVRILDLASGRQKGHRPGEETGETGLLLRPEALAFSPDGKLLAVGGPRGEVHLLDAETAQLRLTLAGPGQAAACLIFSPRGDRIFAGYEKESRLWALPSDAAKLPPPTKLDLFGKPKEPEKSALISR
jgi:WD40 repeat protein